MAPRIPSPPEGAAPPPRPARGTREQPPPRYLDRVVEPSVPPDPEAAPPPTEVRIEHPRSVLSRNTSPDVPFDRSVNPYRGCEHGCVYCYARPSHAYLDLSPGLDFETKLVAKVGAAAALERALRARGYRPAPLALGANTDPYQPVERIHRITRGVLEVLAAYGHPVTVVTKATLVLRDLDLLAPMARRGLAHVLVSITTLDHDLARRLEPRAAAPRRRLAVVQRLAEAGVPVGVLVSPVIPALNDGEVEAICAAAASAGARAAGTILLRLPGEVRKLFETFLDEHFRARKGRVLSLLRQCRGGRLDDPRFGHRMRGGGPYAELLRKRFRLACRRYGLAAQLPPLRTDAFRVPAAPVIQGTPQLSLPLADPQAAGGRRQAATGTPPGVRASSPPVP